MPLHPCSSLHRATSLTVRMYARRSTRFEAGQVANTSIAVHDVSPTMVPLLLPQATYRGVSPTIRVPLPPPPNGSQSPTAVRARRPSPGRLCNRDPEGAERTPSPKKNASTAPGQVNL